MKEELKEKLRALWLRSNTLAVFRGLREDSAVSALLSLLHAAAEERRTEALSAYGAFIAALYVKTSSLTGYLLQLVLQDENFYMKGLAHGKAQPPEIEACALAELAFFQELGSLTSAEFKDLLRGYGYDGYLGDWQTSKTDFAAEYKSRLDRLPTCGYGIYAKYRVFSFTGERLLPVRHPDGQALSQLSGYARERELVLRNTKVLIDGGAASNVLLYGDAGTGKSSTIKAVANHFSDQGLRLIEVKKNQLYKLPLLLEELTANPLKFIIFIDDLSFMSNDDNFSALKAILEGSVSACGRNIAIYATSNRRHLVKETMEERAGDELHLNDTLQETMSLAARFGLTITFQKPDRDQYLSIVRDLAAQYSLDMPEADLIRRAEAFAIRSNGRSPRTAKHFVELQKAGF